MRLFGYARVSTNQQSLDLQIKTLKNEGVEDHRIFYDKASGANPNREGLQLIKYKVESGDVLLVPYLDRLGRDLFDMLKIIKEFTDMGVGIRFLGEGLSTEGSEGEMMIHMWAVFAHSQRKRLLERTNEGRLEAQAKGVKFGRKRWVDRKKLIDLHAKGWSAINISKELNIRRTTVYKILKEEFKD